MTDTDTITELTGSEATIARERHAQAARRALAAKRASKGAHSGGNIVPLDELLTLTDVMAITSLSRASIYRGMHRGEFPRSIQVSRGRVAWRASGINTWIATRSEAAPQAA